MNKELKKLVAEKTIKIFGHCTLRMEGFLKGAQFMYDHLTMPLESDEQAAQNAVNEWKDSFAKGFWPVITDNVLYDEPLIELYLTACAQKNAVIAARDFRIFELENRIKDLSNGTTKTI